MHSVAPRQEMAFPHHAHAHASSGHGPRRHNTTTALDTSSIDSMSHSSHIRVNSLSSKGSLSDYPLLRTPQDSVQSENDALIVKSQDEPSAWKPSMGIVQETLTSSPIDESFGARARAGSTGGKPLSMHINTNFTQRSRAVPFSAHPNQKLPATSQIPAPQSATAAFPPMQLPTANATATNAVNGTNNTSATRSQLPRPTEVKLPDIPPNHNVAPSQHRRTQSAPLLSLSPIAQTSPTETPNPITPPLTTAYPSNANVLQRSTSYNQLDTSVSLQQQPSYPQVNPMAQASVAATTTSFSPFPAMPPFTAGMPGVPQVASPLVWPQFFPQAAPTNFYTPRPPNMSPTSSPTAVPNMYSPTPSVTATWKINPNSQPQMPLSHLISQAQGLVVGGPSAHNRKIGLYKTEICRNWEEKQTCRYGVKCQFAHGPSDLRIVPRHPKYKTEICRTFWVTGSCPYGKRCCFIHPTSGAPGQANGANPNTVANGGNVPNQSSPNGMSPNEDDTSHTISLLARLDLRNGTPDGINGARHTPDSNASTDPSIPFVYPGMNGHGSYDGERNASSARV